MMGNRNEHYVSNAPASRHPQVGEPRHLPPHLRTSMIRLNYDDRAIARLSRIYEDVDYLIGIIESSPPEMKLNLAIVLDIQVDIADYPQNFHHPHIRFETPFINRRNGGLIESSIRSANPEAVVNIYNNCPPEQALLALAIAAMKRPGDEA